MWCGIRPRCRHVCPLRRCLHDLDMWRKPWFLSLGLVLGAPCRSVMLATDDTSVVGLISNNDETHYREEVAQLAEWCGANNLSLNVEKTKEVVMDFRRNSVDHPPLTIDTSTVERVSSTKFLGVHITEDLTWTTNTKSISKKAQQRLHFLRRLKRASLPPPILTTFYRGTIESVLTSCITVWYGNWTARPSSGQ